jgi:hypothetical protein
MEAFGIFHDLLALLWPVGKFHGRLVYFVAPDVFSPFWYVVPRKIWQPCKLKDANASKQSLKFVAGKDGGLSRVEEKPIRSPHGRWSFSFWRILNYTPALYR